MEESLGRGSLHAHIPSGGDTAGVDPPVHQFRRVPTPWGVRCGVPGSPSSPHSRGQLRLTSQCWDRPGALNLLGAQGLSLPTRRVVAVVPMLGSGQQPRAEQHHSSTTHLYANCWRPIGLRCPPVPITTGMLKALTPHTQRVPMATGPEHHPGSEHHRYSRTTGAKTGPQCARVPSPRQPPSPSAGCLPVTRRIAMGDFSQLGDEELKVIFSPGCESIGSSIRRPAGCTRGGLAVVVGLGRGGGGLPRGPGWPGWPGVTTLAQTPGTSPPPQPELSPLWAPQLSFNPTLPTPRGSVPVMLTPGLRCSGPPPVSSVRLRPSGSPPRLRHPPRAPPLQATCKVRGQEGMAQPWGPSGFCGDPHLTVGTLIQL